MNTKKSKDNVIWKNDNEISREVKAYFEFIETLKVRLRLIAPFIEKEIIDQSVFQDILTGCAEIKAAIKAGVEKRAAAYQDQELKDLLFDSLEKKLEKIDNISVIIKEGLVINPTGISSIIINPDFIIFDKKGNISYDEKSIVDKWAVKIDNDLKRDIYEKAEQLLEQIKIFNKYVVESTHDKFKGIHSDRYSDTSVISIYDNYEVEINPFIIEQLNGSSPDMSSK